jgi:hypothetical protein
MAAAMFLSSTAEISGAPLRDAQRVNFARSHRTQLPPTISAVRHNSVKSLSKISAAQLICTPKPDIDGRGSFGCANRYTSSVLGEQDLIFCRQGTNKDGGS